VLRLRVHRRRGEGGEDSAGAGSLLAAITYGVQPYGGQPTGWTNPWVLGGLVVGAAFLGAFCIAETRIAEPMFQLGLFGIRAFAAGNLASLLLAIARGGMQFMLIMWLQGIWLPLRGYDFERTPLWAGINDEAGYLQRLRRAIDAAHAAEVPVIYVVVGFRTGHPEISTRNKSFSAVPSTLGLADGDPNAEISALAYIGM
jgi:hypothetical protein